MSRKNDVFQKAVNHLLEHISENLSIRQNLPSDSAIASLLDVSRSTARKSLEYLIELKVIEKKGSKRIIVSMPIPDNHFNQQQLNTPKNQQVEQHFMRLILDGKIKPGNHFSELELARQSGCNTVTVREFLIRFSRFGLIDKKPRSQWQMKTFDESFVDQLYEVRHLFEMHSLARFLTLEDDNVYWKELETLLIDHKQLRLTIDQDYQKFSQLDQRFHSLLQSAHPNQFVSQFYEIISFVFHYHYQWDKSDEKERNSIAIDEHVDIISKMLFKDFIGATASLEKHLNTAKQSLKKTVFH